MNASLIHAGQDIELPAAGLTAKDPHLLVDDAFNFAKFGASFEFAVAVSVFTHISTNAIERCLVNIADVLVPSGKFYATYFPAPRLHSLEPLRHADLVTTYSDRDPFHYHLSVFQFLTTDLPLSVRNVGDWGHPRGQHMLEFTRS
jgi:SAM-dependent methyltransferase